MKQEPRKVKCPHCGTPTVWEGNAFRPFCSERCRLLDLGDWAAERHRIPGEETDREDPGSSESNSSEGE